MRRILAAALIALCPCTRADASRIGFSAAEAYERAVYVLQVVVDREWRPGPNAAGRARKLDEYDNRGVALYRVSVKNVFKAPDAERVPATFIIYVPDAHILSTGMGPQLAVGRTYVTCLEKAEIERFVSKHYDLPPPPVWSQLENWEVAAKDEASVARREALVTVFGYKKLTDDAERTRVLEDILRTSDSRMLVRFAIRQSYRTRLPLGEALKAAAGRVLGNDPRLAVSALLAAKHFGVPPDSAHVKELFSRGPASAPSGSAHLVGEGEIDDLQYALKSMLESRAHTDRSAAIKKLAELRPEYLEDTIALGGHIDAFVYYQAVRELRRVGYEFKRPLRYGDVLDLPHSLALAVCQAYDGRMSHLSFAAEYEGTPQHSFELWARALRLIEFRLNDPDARRAATVVSAFRSRGVGLRLVDGKYRVVTYETPASPPVTLEVEIPDRVYRVGDSVRIAVVERAAAVGGRISFAGAWRVTISGPGGASMPHLRDKGDGGPRYVRLEAGSWRRTNVTSHMFRRPGRYRISASKVYEVDDRADRGAWTGAVASEKVEVDVGE
ncbi:MAG: hypothetical protein ACYS9X_01600 [Planctomycetota bacterium]|jgi:hypothetical protein